MNRAQCFDLVVGDKVRKVRSIKSVDYQEVIFDLALSEQEVHTVTWKGMGETITDLIKQFDVILEKNGISCLKQASISNHFMISCYELEQ